VSYDSAEEIDLIRRASGTPNPTTGVYEDRDRDAFTELYHRTFPRIRAICYKMLHNDADRAGEVINSAFLQIWNHLPQFRGGSAFTTWATRIAINEVRMHLRQGKKYRGTLSLDEPHPGESNGEEIHIQLAMPTLEIDGIIDRERIKKALSRVPPRYRIFLQLRILGMSNEEIFADKTLRDQLGLKTMPTLKSSMLRARRMFISEWKDISSAKRRRIRKVKTV
jgi:RNA polymerase sigma-70 factor (ECF subfamily)